MERRWPAFCRRSSACCKTPTACWARKNFVTVSMTVLHAEEKEHDKLSLGDHTGSARKARALPLHAVVLLCIYTRTSNVLLVAANPLGTRGDGCCRSSGFSCLCHTFLKTDMKVSQD